jgi:hypothetical protein
MSILEQDTPAALPQVAANQQLFKLKLAQAISDSQEARFAGKRLDVIEASGEVFK